MPRRSHSLTRPRRRAALAGALLVALPLVSAAACSSDDSPEPKLSADGAKGKLVAQRLNCQACHSTDGTELTGPSWKDLYGATIKLKGKGTVTIDADYIRRAIRSPGAERREDATGQMPLFDESRLSDADLDLIVAYIEDLSSKKPTS